MLKYNRNLKTFSRRLRNNMTDSEIRLWSKIRGKQLKELQFYRQKIIGNYIVDFYCPKAKLVIELDGGQHLKEDGIQKDKERDAFLNSLGLRVMRFSSRDVFTNLNGILHSIYENISTP